MYLGEMVNQAELYHCGEDVGEGDEDKVVKGCRVMDLVLIAMISITIIIISSSSSVIIVIPLASLSWLQVQGRSLSTLL